MVGHDDTEPCLTTFPVNHVIQRRRGNEEEHNDSSHASAGPIEVKERCASLPELDIEVSFYLLIKTIIIYNFTAVIQPLRTTFPNSSSNLSDVSLLASSLFCRLLARGPPCPLCHSREEPLVAGTPLSTV